MNRKESYRMAVIVLGVVLVLSVSGMAFVRYVVSPPPAAVPRAQTSSERAPSEPPQAVAASQVAKPKLDNELIAQRNLFQPLVETKAETPPPPAKPVVQPNPVPRPLPAPPPMPAFRPTQTQNPPQPQVAVVGSFKVNNERFALVEDLTKGESRMVGEGESAFGYRVARINDETVTLERDGDTLHLALGENKPQRGARLAGGMMPTAGGASQAALAQLPPNLQSTVSRLMPAGGEMRVRTDTENGQLVYRVNQRVNGLDYSLRLAPDGRVLRMSNEVRHTDMPSAVAASANSALAGYRVNPNDTPRMEVRDGQTYYQIEVVPEGGGREIDLRIAPDGRVIGRD